jgi:hypothetical protein
MQQDSLFRSREMELVQVQTKLKKLYIPLEISTQTVAELGEFGELQVNDV